MPTSTPSPQSDYLSFNAPGCESEIYFGSEQFYIRSISDSECGVSLLNTYEIVYPKTWNVRTTGAWQQNIVLNDTILVVPYGNQQQYDIDTFLLKDKESLVEYSNQDKISAPYFGVFQSDWVISDTESKKIGDRDVRIITHNYKSTGFDNTKVYIYTLENSTVMSLYTVKPYRETDATWNIDEISSAIEKLIPQINRF